MSSRWAEQQSLLARKFFLATICQAVVCVALATGLAAWLGAPEQRAQIRLPNSFLFGAAFLALGSYCLHMGKQHVQREKQVEFRRSLLLALGFAILFVSVQSFGLWGFMKSTTDYQNTQQNTHGFVFVFAVLHGMHFVVAQSVLLWVTLAAHNDRYDHEYYFGVTFATWFWHALGIVWLGILLVFVIARQYG